jgi:hypothetical protein
MSCSCDLNLERDTFKRLEREFGTEVASQYFASSMAHFKIEGLLRIRAGVVTYTRTENDLVCDTFSWKQMHTGQIALPELTRDAALKAAELARQGQTAMYLGEEHGSNQITVNLLIPNPLTNEVVAHVLYLDKEGPTARHQMEQIEKILGKIPPEGQVATRLVTAEHIDRAIEAVTDGEVKSEAELRAKVLEETKLALEEIKKRGIDTYINDLTEAFSKESSDLVKSVRISVTQDSEGRFEQANWSEVSPGRLGLAVALREAIVSQGGLDSFTTSDRVSALAVSSRVAELQKDREVIVTAEKPLAASPLAILREDLSHPLAQRGLGVASIPAAPGGGNTSIEASASLERKNAAAAAATPSLGESEKKSAETAGATRAISPARIEIAAETSRTKEAKSEERSLYRLQVTPDSSRTDNSQVKSSSRLELSPALGDPRKGPENSASISIRTPQADLPRASPRLPGETLFLAVNQIVGTQNPGRTLSPSNSYTSRISSLTLRSNAAGEVARASRLNLSLSLRRTLTEASASRALALRGEIALIRNSLRGFREAALSTSADLRKSALGELSANILLRLKNGLRQLEDIRASLAERLRSIFPGKSLPMDGLLSLLQKTLRSPQALSHHPELIPPLQEIRRLRFALKYPAEMLFDKALGILPRPGRERLVELLSLRVARSMRALDRLRNETSVSREAYQSALLSSLTRLALLRRALLSVGRRDDSRKLSAFILQLLEELHALGISASELQQAALIEADWVLARASSLKTRKKHKRRFSSDDLPDASLEEKTKLSSVRAPRSRGKKKQEIQQEQAPAPFQAPAVSGPKDYLETIQSIEKVSDDSGFDGGKIPFDLSDPNLTEIVTSTPSRIQAGN